MFLAASIGFVLCQKPDGRMKKDNNHVIAFNDRTIDWNSLSATVCKHTCITHIVHKSETNLQQRWFAAAVRNTSFEVFKDAERSEPSVLNEVCSYKNTDISSLLSMHTQTQSHNQCVNTLGFFFQLELHACVCICVLCGFKGIHIWEGWH